MEQSTGQGGHAFCVSLGWSMPCRHLCPPRRLRGQYQVGVAAGVVPVPVGAEHSLGSGGVGEREGERETRAVGERKEHHVKKHPNNDRRIWMLMILKLMLALTLTLIAVVIAIMMMSRKRRLVLIICWQ